jgi:probable rRNA maturation factor
MEVQITSQRRIPGLRSLKIKQKARKVLRELDLHDVELSVLLTDDATISNLNRRYLRKSGPTNVLAFPMGEQSLSKEPTMLGDVVISLDTALKESILSSESLEQTISRLLVHGILHLLGYDHEKSRAESRRMKREEKRLLALIP